MCPTFAHPVSSPFRFLSRLVLFLTVLQYLSIEKVSGQGRRTVGKCRFLLGFGGTGLLEIGHDSVTGSMKEAFFAAENGHGNPMGMHGFRFPRY
jgi:hypothetical protein